VTPKVLPVTVTFENSQELSNEIRSKIGGKLIVDAELSVSGSVANTTGQTRQLILNHLTGGLDIVQE
jgi:hypothetical protein